MKFRLILLFVLGLSACGGNTVHIKNNSDALADITNRVWQNALSQNLEMHLRHHNDITQIPDLTLEQAQAHSAFAREILDELRKLPTETLSHDQHIDYLIVRETMEVQAQAAQFYWLEFSVTPYQAMSRTIPAQQLIQLFPLEEEQDLEDYLVLVSQYAGLVEQMGAKLIEQRQRGILLPKPAIPVVKNTFGEMRRTAKALVTVSSDRLASFDEATRASFEAEVTVLAETRLEPAFDAIINELSDDYLEQASDAVGLAQYDKGGSFYSHQIRKFTTLDLSAEDIHQIGLERVAELEGKMAAIRNQLGWAGTRAQFDETLRTDSRFLAESPEEVEAILMGHVERMEPLVDQYFSTTPEAPYRVLPLPSAGEGGLTFGYYQPPTAAEPNGTYYFNGSNLSERTMTTAAGLIFHELIPGHHFHIALQHENENLSGFRSDMLTNAFTEGWAEYAANLGWEMGLYDDPYDQYGRLGLELFLAVRLVVDTGMNHYGWSLEEARTFMSDRLSESDAQIASESLRYSVDLPAQALGYRLGFEWIWRLREKAERELGDDFDLREFHTQILSGGGMPLSVLSEHINWYIAKKSNGK